MGCSNSPSVNNDNCMVNGYATPKYPYTNQGNNNYSNAIIKEQEKRKDSVFETYYF